MANSPPEQSRRWPEKLLGPLLAGFLLLGLGALPVVLWLDLDALSVKMLGARADETARIIDIMRSTYSSEVVTRILHAEQKVTTSSNYKNINGAVPIPATLSIELGSRISAGDANVKYRFVSDLPFKGRDDHVLDDFERGALQKLRADKSAPVFETTGTAFNRQYRVATPVVLAEACVTCHNSHPDSPKTDWKVGDVRGIQEVIVSQSLDANMFSFKHLLSYIVLAALGGTLLVFLQRRQAAMLNAANTGLAEANDFLAGISIKIAKYIPPQIYKSIFSGERDVTIATERKKLTIFFSDIKDFTATAERLQPEDLTSLLNEYFTEMSTIALAHGGTVDKFIGDAMLVFFGDPETKGIKEDARACLRMAAAMKDRLVQLNIEWRQKGIENPFRVRMGINTGYCNVGNFGSNDRMDYTIIGAEANFAARLQSIAEPDEIMLSYETYVLVGDMVRAQPKPPISIKGISRSVVPYAVERYLGDTPGQKTFSAKGAGLDLTLNPHAMDEASLHHAKSQLRDALAVLEQRRGEG